MKSYKNIWKVFLNIKKNIIKNENPFYANSIGGPINSQLSNPFMPN